MATITLKDLMDPLSKIAAATEKTAQKLDAVIAAVTGGSGASLNQELFKELQIQTDILRTIAGNTKSSGINVNGKQVNQDKLKEGANAIKLLGGGAASLAAGLLMFMLVPRSVIKKFTLTIEELMAAFDNIDPTKVEKGAKSFEIIAGSIGKFARGLAMAGILFIPAMIGVGLIHIALKILMPTFAMLGDSEKKVGKGAEILGIMGSSLQSFAKGLVLAAIGSAVGILFTPLIVLSMLIIGGAFALLGKLDKFIRRGAETLGVMGKSLVWFSVGLVTFALVSMFILIQPVILLAMVGVLVLIGGAMALLGSFSSEIKRGSVALALVGVALAIFSIGYAIFALATENVELSDIGIQALLLVSLGAVFALAGLGIKFIALGAISFIAIGIGLAVFSLGYLPFAIVMKGTTYDDIGIQLSLLLGVGSTFAAAGLAAVAIIPGAFAFAAIGGALWALSKGLTAFKNIKFTEDDAKNLTLTLSGIKTAFLGTEPSNETGVKGFFSKIGGAITGAVDAVRMVEAAAGFTAAGVALTALSKGLISFKNVSWSDELSLELTTMLTGITTAFALAGGEQVPSTSFFGQMFGFKRTAVEEGIKSVKGAGKALIDIVKGLESFQTMVEKDIDWDKLGDSITYSIGFIQEAFAAVADEGNVQGGGFFDSLFKIKRNKVAEGISSVSGAGKALAGIVTGLKSFQDLVDKDIDWDKLGFAVTKSIGFVQEAFAAVADEGNVQGGGFFDSLFKIKRNKVAEGISSVSGAGKELTNIVTGLKSFQDLVDKDIDWDKLGDAVKKSIGFVGEAFANIGEQKQTKAISVFGLPLISWDQNKVKKGIRSVKGAGDELTNIVTGLKSFQDLVDKDIDWDKLGSSISKSIGFVGEAFASVAGQKEKGSAAFGLIKWDKNLVDKGITAVKGAGAELTNIAKGLQSFANLQNPSVIANSIKKIFTSIGDTFTFYYEKPKFKSQLDHMKGFVTEISDNAKKGYIDKAAKGMNDIAKAVNSINQDKAEAFANLFKGAGDLTNNQDAFEALLEAVEEIRDALSGTANAQAAAPGTAALQTTAGDSAALTPILNSINASLSRLNGTMTSLPGQIQSIKIVIPD